MKKEYYIQGDPARANEIKAAFEEKGCTLYRLASNCDSEDLIYYSLNGIVRGIKKDNLYLFEAHPGYKELELPTTPKFNVGDKVIYKGKVRTITRIVEGYYEFDGWAASCRIEKQDELLSAAPNFKVGDWVVTDYGKVSQVVSVDKDGYVIERTIDGETVADVLEYVQYDPKKLVRRLEIWVSKAIKEGKITEAEGKEFISNYRAGLYGYTYLE
jgi:hypothetical protein